MFEYRNLNIDKIVVWTFVGLLLLVPATGIAISLSDEENSEINREKILKSSENKTTVVVFYTDNCKYCDKTLSYVSNEVDNQSNVTLKSYEVGSNKTNENLYQKSIKSSHTGVPAIQVGNKTWFGYTESLENDVRNKIRECNSTRCGVPEVHQRE